MKLWILFILLNALVALGSCSDITGAVFGKELDGMPAAFGDFNSDELTDVFVLRNDLRTVQIMLASTEEPLLQARHEYSCVFDQKVTSVVPGDFDGDVFMDVMVTTLSVNKVGVTLTNVYILWGSNQKLNCSDAQVPLFQMKGQPLAIDYNQDMIVDLFGSNVNGNRTFWIFNTNRTEQTQIVMQKPRKFGNITIFNTCFFASYVLYKLFYFIIPDEWLEIRAPHANAFLDLNSDFYPDLVVTTDKHFEIWHGKKSGFEFKEKIPLPTNPLLKSLKIGQSLHLDVELEGKIDFILPTCEDVTCEKSSIMIYSDGKWQDMNVNFMDSAKTQWKFAFENGRRYVDTITMRGGDFNMDGYPDLLATLQSTTIPYEMRSFLLENVQCDQNCGAFNRTFTVRWNALNPFVNQSVMGVFYDFYQDGNFILSKILEKCCLIIDGIMTVLVFKVY